MKRQCICIVIVILISALMLTACWDSIEIEELGIVVLAGFDTAQLGSGKKGVSLEVSIIRAGATRAAGQTPKPTDQKNLWHASAQGETIYEAFNNLYNTSTRRLFWGHTQFIIVGSELARDGIDKYIDYFSRHLEMRRNAFILVSRTTTHEILHLDPQVELFLNDEILNMIQKAQQWNEKRIPTINDYLVWRSVKGREPVLPILEAVPGSPANVGKLSEPYSDDAKAIVSLDGSAVFKGDRMVGSMNKDEVQGYLFVTNRMKGGNIQVKPFNEDKYVSLRVLDSNYKVTPSIKYGRYFVDIQVNVQLDLAEANDPDLALNKKEGLQLISEKTGERIKEKINMTIDRAQKEFKSDIFGFGSYFHRKYPGQWKQIKNTWNEVFQGVEYNTTVWCDIRSTRGIIRPESYRGED